MVVNSGLLCLAMSLADGTKFLEVWQERFRWLIPVLPLRRAACAGAHRRLREDRRHRPARIHAPAGRDDVLGPPVRQPHAPVRRGRARGERRAQGRERRSSRRGTTTSRRCSSSPAASPRAAHDRGSLTAYAEDALHTPDRRAAANDRARRGRGRHRPRRRRHPDRQPAHRRDSAARGRALEPSPRARSSPSSRPRSRAPGSSKRSGRSSSRRSPRSRARWRRRTTTPAATRSASPTSPSPSPRGSATQGLELDAIEIGALLHDIGKIGIPERILHKPGPLDDEEWKVMKEHPVISEYILSGGRPRPDRAPDRPLEPRADRRPGLSGRARRATRSRCRRGSSSSPTPSTR